MRLDATVWILRSELYYSGSVQVLKHFKKISMLQESQKFIKSGESSETNDEILEKLPMHVFLATSPEEI